MAAIALFALMAGCDAGSQKECVPGAKCGGYPPCGTGEKRIDGECVVAPTVYLSSVGYLPNRIKIATFADDGGDAFEVRSASGDKVLEGTASEAVMDPDTGVAVRQADFSELMEPGEYYVVVGGVGRSAPFRIDSDVFAKPLETAMLGLYGQRCGVEVEIESDVGHYHHPACHTAEASLQALGLEGTRDDTGGWHDAGDYGKYTGNGAFAVAFLLKAYEHFPEGLRGTELLIPEQGGSTPDMLDEARVELEWLQKTQLEDGSAAHKVTAKNFEGPVSPEADTQQRFFVPAGTVATADLAAVMALAARIYEPFDEDFAASCLEAAQRAYAYLQDHPDIIEPNQEGFTTGGYNDGSDRDDRQWAAAELFETTGDADVLADFDARARTHESIETAFDWTRTGNLAFLTYLFSSRDGRDPGIVDAIATSLQSAGDSLVDKAATHAYGRAIGSTYYWGINGVVARTSLVLAAAYRLDQDPKYLDALTLQLDHLFGRNPYGRSYVTAVGWDPPVNPHHRPSQASSKANPWPGLLVGGPHGKPFVATAEEVPPALTWADDATDYMHNEVAINWNTALVYALVAAQHAED
jgi:endoglucanase